MKGNIKYIGQGKVVDKNGEIHEAPEILKQAPHENFQKMQVMTMALAIDHIGNKKMKVISYIMDHISYTTNMLVITQRKLAKILHFSTKTVEETIKCLREANILKTRPGVIMLSPKLMMKGRHQHYCYLLFHFKQANNVDRSKESQTKATNHKPSKIKTDVQRHKSMEISDNQSSTIANEDKNKEPVVNDK